MMAADPHGHRYEISPGGALSVMPPPDSEHAAIASRLLRDAAQTVTLYHLGATGEYAVATKIPLAWLLNTAPAEHLS